MNLRWALPKHGGFDCRLGATVLFCFVPCVFVYNFVILPAHPKNYISLLGVFYAPKSSKRNHFVQHHLEFKVPSSRKKKSRHPLSPTTCRWPQRQRVNWMPPMATGWCRMKWPTEPCWARAFPKLWQCGCCSALGWVVGYHNMDRKVWTSFFRKQKVPLFGGWENLVWLTSLQKIFVLLHCIIVVFQFEWTDIDIHITDLGEQK